MLSGESYQRLKLPSVSHVTDRSEPYVRIRSFAADRPYRRCVRSTSGGFHAYLGSNCGAQLRQIPLTQWAGARPSLVDDGIADCTDPVNPHFQPAALPPPYPAPPPPPHP